jgi:hypothetical protein
MTRATNGGYPAGFRERGRRIARDDAWVHFDEQGIAITGDDPQAEDRVGVMNRLARRMLLTHRWTALLACTIPVSV